MESQAVFQAKTQANTFPIESTPRLSESRNNCVGVISPCSSDDDDDIDDDIDDFDVSSSEDLPPPKLYTMAATAPSPTRRSVRSHITPSITPSSANSSLKSCENPA